MRFKISIHALREEGDCLPESGRYPAGNFYPRPPRGGRLPRDALAALVVTISIHALREEGDEYWPSEPSFLNRFLSTPSARRATHNRVHLRILYLFLSTPSARRATFRSSHGLIAIIISIHALREEGDAWLKVVNGSHTLFLSTPSARRATSRRWWGNSGHADFYPRPPRGGRRPSTTLPKSNTRNFYPRPPRGGRPLRPVDLGTLAGISIHALREEGDAGAVSVLLYPVISIHALREEGDRRM